MKRFVVNDEALDVEQLMEFHGKDGGDFLYKLIPFTIAFIEFI